MSLGENERCFGAYLNAIHITLLCSPCQSNLKDPCRHIFQVLLLFDMFRVAIGNIYSLLIASNTVSILETPCTYHSSLLHYLYEDEE